MQWLLTVVFKSCVVCVYERAFGFYTNPKIISLTYKEQQFIIIELFYVFICFDRFLCCTLRFHIFWQDLNMLCAFRALTHSITTAAGFVQRWELLFSSKLIAYVFLRRKSNLNCWENRHSVCVWTKKSEILFFFFVLPLVKVVIKLLSLLSVFSSARCCDCNEYSNTVSL